MPWIEKKGRQVGDIAAFLYVQRVRGLEAPDAPDLNPESLAYFSDRLAHARQYLEFGSGGSTMLAARLKRAFTTVETDRFFLAALRRKLADRNLLDPARQRFIHVDIGVTELYGAPLVKWRTPRRLARWRAYADAPWTPDAPRPDLVLVDGRFRVAAALTAVRRLGAAEDWELLMDDYAPRRSYRVVEAFARLERMVGRMAVFRARPDVDAAALDRAIAAAQADYR